MTMNRVFMPVCEFDSCLNMWVLGGLCFNMGRVCTYIDQSLSTAARGSHQCAVPESERKRSLRSPLLSGTQSRAGKHLGAKGEQTNPEEGRGRRGKEERQDEEGN